MVSSFIYSYNLDFELLEKADSIPIQKSKSKPINRRPKQPKFDNPPKPIKKLKENWIDRITSIPLKKTIESNRLKIDIEPKIILVTETLWLPSSIWEHIFS